MSQTRFFSISSQKLSARQKGITFLVGLMAFIPLFSSCVSEKEDECRNNRTILVYMGGDNNLSGKAYNKLDALQQGFNGSLQGRLLVYLDPADASPQLLEIELDDTGKAVPRIIKTYEESNSADASVFKTVVQEVVTAYPAPSYGLIVFSHGSGWLPTKTFASPRSILVDQDDEMEFSDFAQAIPDETFDFILLESCFGSSIEALYELKEKTKFVLASSAEIMDPGFNDLYANGGLRFLYQATPDLKAFAQQFYTQVEQKEGVYQSGTIAVVQTHGLTQLSEFIRQTAHWDLTIDLPKIQPFDRRTGPHLFFDFEHYFAQLIPADRQAEFSALLRQCVVYQAATATFMLPFNGFKIEHHSGLTTYIQQPEFPYLNEAYRQLNWYRETHPEMRNSSSKQN